MKIAIAIVVALALLGGIAATLFVYFGVYDVAATRQHTAPVFWVLEFASRRAVVQRAKDITPPPLDDAAMIDRGFRLYQANCLQCHGAPGVAPEAIALGLTPIPANLVLTAREWKPAELFWVVKNGLKMTGMPAWEFRLPERDLWAIVAFVEELKTMTPLEYKERARAVQGLDAETVAPAPDRTPARGDSERGATAIRQYACSTCHEIPGIVGASKPVGPPLGGIATRGFLAGVLPNTPVNMMRWLMDPLGVSPRTAMPDLRISERDARDIAAYLYTLE